MENIPLFETENIIKQELHQNVTKMNSLKKYNVVGVNCNMKFRALQERQLYLLDMLMWEF